MLPAWVFEPELSESDSGEPGSNAARLGQAVVTWLPDRCSSNAYGGPTAGLRFPMPTTVLGHQEALDWCKWTKRGCSFSFDRAGIMMVRPCPFACRPNRPSGWYRPSGKRQQTAQCPLREPCETYETLRKRKTYCEILRNLYVRKLAKTHICETLRILRNKRKTAK